MLLPQGVAYAALAGMPLITGIYASHGRGHQVEQPAGAHQAQRPPPSLQLFDWQSILYGIASIALLVLAKRWRAAFPSAIFIIALTGVISWATDFADDGGAVAPNSSQLSNPGNWKLGRPAGRWPTTSKISAGLFGSFATSASFSRSAVNLLAGAKTGWSNVFSILLVVIVVLWFIPPSRRCG